MRIGSFYEEDSQLKPLEIEMALWPGLPTIHFVGRADPQLKESALRIKSAIKAAGFRFPVTQQILVNLAPTHVKKTSRGLELAVALLYLWKTEQIPQLDFTHFDWVYGELGLDGRVIAPSDLDKIRLPRSARVLSGDGDDKPKLFSVASLKHLGEGESLEWKLPLAVSEKKQRPQLPEPLFFTKEEARLLTLLGVGGHHALFAGPAGTGKSSLGRAAYHLLPDITFEEAKEHLVLQTSHPGEGVWRPLVEPHHSTPRMAMIGGGSPPRPGEIARAHAGLLLMDEFLEFEPHVLESLREPFERGELRVGRLGGVEKYRANSQIIATTNLCPCGSFVPGRSRPSRCRFSLKKCFSYSERLSGPLLDRFHILHFTREKREERSVPISKIRDQVLEIHEWQIKTRGFSLTRNLEATILWKDASSELQSLGISSQPLSDRRRVAVLRVARSLADMEGLAQIGLRQVDEAISLSLEPFQRLNRWQIEQEC